MKNKERGKAEVSSSIFYKNNPSDRVYWVENDAIGVYEFSFDQKKVFNLFRDYPHNLTPEQKRIFDAENPYWANFFKGRN